MNNVYVDKVPTCCDECPCCNSDIDYGACCNLGAYGYVDYYPTTRNHPNCPLKPLSDRLAEERKKVVQEIKFQARARGIFGQNGKFMGYHEFNEILDQIEGVSDDNS